jgi:transcriptional regulator with XRE-family HTH domain
MTRKLFAITLGERLMILRRRAGLGTIEVAESLRCSPVTLTRWEHDRTRPSFANTVLLANLYCVEVADLHPEDFDQTGAA